MSQEVFAYKRINLILAGVILGIFLYSGFFNYKTAKHPIKSNYSKITGEPSMSTGLSRSFSAIVRLDFTEARAFNPHGISLFTFFLVQFFLRIFFFFQLKNPLFDVNLILIIDVVISGALFLLHFEPFIKDLVHR